MEYKTYSDKLLCSITEEIFIIEKLGKYKCNDTFFNKYKSKFAVELSEIYKKKKKQNQTIDIFYIDKLEDYIYFINVLLLDFYNESNTKKVREHYMFRGFSDLKQMQTKLITNNVINEEFNAIRKFEENACVRLGQYHNPIDLVAAAQHYGVFTRLIDWTTSPLIATLFALYNEDNFNEKADFYGVAFRKYGKGIVLKSLYEDEQYINYPLSFRYKNMIEMFEKLIKCKSKIDCKKILSKDKLENLIKNNFNGCNDNEKNSLTEIYNQIEYIAKKTNINYDKKSDKVIRLVRKFLFSSQVFIETNYSNERLRNQRGLFQIDYFEKDGYKDNKNIIESRDWNILNGTSILLISKAARKEIIKYINDLGINYYILMNDEENISKVINKTSMKSISFDRRVE